MLRYTYLAYYPLFLTFTIWVFCRLFIWYLPHVIRAIPAAVAEVTMQAAPGSTALFTIVSSVLRLAVLLLPLIAVFMYVRRIVNRVWAFVAASLVRSGRAPAELLVTTDRQLRRE
jgi:hypothetical protein